MFRNKDDRPQVMTHDAAPIEPRPKGNYEPTRIAAGTTVRGDIMSPGSAMIDGKVEGSINAQGDVQIGAKGEVGGEIEAKNITVAGKVKGKLYADDKVQLLAGAHVDGDIHSQSLKIEDSVFFHGGCNMGEGARSRRADTLSLVPGTSNNPNSGSSQNSVQNQTHKLA
jgi:cytoskeletal protein CcmA (bactofilin family)